jgi:hypothetical protein
VTETETRCTCPAQARAILENLEAKIALDIDHDPLNVGADGDRNDDAPACAEPPD